MNLAYEFTLEHDPGESPESLLKRIRRIADIEAFEQGFSLVYMIKTKKLNAREVRVEVYADWLEEE